MAGSQFKDILKKINPRYLPLIEAARAAQGRMPVLQQVETEQGERVRQKVKKISVLEERWGTHVRQLNPAALIYPQFPLSVGNGSNYYLDYLIVIREPKLAIWGHEVKGPYSRSTGIVKLKAAARMYPWIKFSMVSETELKKWQLEEILP